MSVSSLECVKIILIKFPAFKKPWLDNLESMGDPFKPTSDVLELTDLAHYKTSLTGIVLDLCNFATFVIDLIEEQKVDDLTLYEIFVVIEFLMLHGDEEVKSAAATGFLETMLHAVPEKVKASTFVPYLGIESVKYCKACDAFTGVKTEGLWD